MLHTFAKRIGAVRRLEDDEADAVRWMEAIVSHVPAGQTIVREGASQEDLLIVTKGLAQRYRLLRSGERQVIGYLLPGDAVGYAGTHAQPSTCTVATASECTLARVRARDVAALARRKPNFAWALEDLRHVERRTLEEWLVNVGRRPGYQRVAHLVCEIRFRIGMVMGKEVDAFELPLTQVDVGDATALSVVHVNRVLQQLRSEHLVHWSRGALRLPDPAKLEKAAGFDCQYLLPAGAIEPVAFINKRENTVPQLHMT